MLLAILALYFVHGRAPASTPSTTASCSARRSIPTRPMWLMLGFFVAFAVKLPVVPLHTWLPDAHTEAPTAGSVILAGLLLKTGAYGLLRFVVPLFPGRRARVRARGHGAGRGRHPLRRRAGLRPDRPQAAGGLHQRQPHGLRAARHLRLERAGAAGRGDADALPRRQHRRALHPGRRCCRSASTPATWTAWAACGRRCRGLAASALLLRHGLAGPARAWATSSASSWCCWAPTSVSIAWRSVATLGLVVATVYALRMVQRAFHGSQHAPLAAARTCAPRER